MGKKWGILCVLCISCALICAKFVQKPKLVSSITTFDTAYLTILVNPFDFINVEKLEKKLVFMCKEDAFENIKLYAEDKTIPRNWNITAYSCMRDLENGENGVRIKFGE